MFNSDVPRLKALTPAFPYSFVCKSSNALFHLEPFVEGLPVVDGVVYKTNSTYGTVEDVSSPIMQDFYIEFDLSNVSRSYRSTMDSCALLRILSNF